jgi:hypothetical protein
VNASGVATFANQIVGSISGSANNVRQNLIAGTGVSFSTGNTYNGSTAITINASGTNADWTATSGVAQILNVTGSGGPTKIAIGRNVGNNQGTSTVAIGDQAGQGNQGQFGVAIGSAAGYVDQGAGAVAIGSAGYDSQGAGAVAIGSGAGDSGQGANAIAIGNQSGGDHQIASSIIINATGSALEAKTRAGLFVAPILSATPTSNVLYYDTTTKEVSYGTVPTVDAFSSLVTTQITTLAVDMTTGPSMIFWQPSANGNRAITLSNFTAGRRVKIFITPHRAQDIFTFTGVTTTQCSNTKNTFVLGGGGVAQASMMIEVFSTTTAIGGVWIFGFGSQ